MKLSTRSRYGLRLMFRLALNYEKGSMQLSEIAKAEDISEKYLGQIVIQLKSSGLINSIRGAQGGYYLTNPPSSTTTREIVEALEGSLSPVDCLDNQECIRIAHCPTKRLWAMMGDKIKETLEGVKLSDLVDWSKKEDKNLAFTI